MRSPIPRVDPDRWRLRIHGDIERETDVSYEEILVLGAAVRRATLDCSGGWYTIQRWSGVPVAALLEHAGHENGARSLLFRSTTGYSRRFPLDEAGDLLLATHVGDEELSAGYDWVKWISEVEASSDPAWLEPPLLLR